MVLRQIDYSVSPCLCGLSFMGVYMNGNGILQKLFTSRARVKLLSTLVLHPDRSFFMREIARETGETFSNIRKEIKNLEELKIITGEQNHRAKYYIINTEHYLYPELKGLVVKTEESEAVTSNKLKDP